MQGTCAINFCFLFFGEIDSGNLICWMSIYLGTLNFMASYVLNMPSWFHSLFESSFISK